MSDDFEKALDVEVEHGDHFPILWVKEANAFRAGAHWAREWLYNNVQPFQLKDDNQKLRSENEWLKAARKQDKIFIVDAYTLKAECERLKARNAELVEALELAINQMKYTDRLFKAEGLDNSLVTNELEQALTAYQKAIEGE